MYVSSETRRLQISFRECAFVTFGPRWTDTILFGVWGIFVGLLVAAADMEL